MAKKKVKRSSARKVSKKIVHTPEKKGRSMRWKLYSSFFNMIFFTIVALIAFVLPSFIDIEFWVATFSLLGILALFIAVAFLIVWLVLLIIAFTKKKE
jgi:uncharacterized Tic20 family protein